MKARLRSTYECGCCKHPAALYPSCMYRREWGPNAHRPNCPPHRMYHGPSVTGVEDSPPPLQVIVGSRRAPVLYLASPEGRSREVDLLAPHQRARRYPDPPAPHGPPYFGWSEPEIPCPGLQKEVFPVPSPTVLPTATYHDLYRNARTCLYYEPPLSFWQQNVRARLTGSTYFRNYLRPFPHYPAFPQHSIDNTLPPQK